MTKLGHHGTVPAPVSELVLTFVDCEAGAASYSHRRPGVLTDQLELTARQRMHRRRQEQVRLRAERVSRHHLTSVRQIPVSINQATDVRKTIFLFYRKNKTKFVNVIEKRYPLFTCFCCRAITDTN